MDGIEAITTVRNDKVYIKIRCDYNTIKSGLEKYEFLDFITKNQHTNNHPLFLIKGIKALTRKAKICDVLKMDYKYNIYYFFEEYKTSITELLD